MRSIPTRSGPERRRYSLHLSSLRFNIVRVPGADSTHALRDFPRMEVVCGAFVRRSRQRIYDSLSSTLRPGCLPVCCRAKISSFHRQGDTTNFDRRSACHPADDLNFESQFPRNGGFRQLRVGGCDSHPKMLYRVAAIHCSVIEAGVFAY
jgi:hypothetical protein